MDATDSDAIKSATEFLLSELDTAMNMLQNFGIDEETIIQTPFAKKFLENLPSLPLTYSDNEKTFIEKLNEAISVLRKNSAVWYNYKNLPHEIWRDVENYEGFYKVSNYGRVKSNHEKRKIVLRPTINEWGYPFCSLCKFTTKRSFQIHRLVAQNFIPNPENKPQVNHKDGNKENACVWNLEWSTSLENIFHAYQAGLKQNRTMTEEQVKYIRKIHKRYDKKFGTFALARYFDVSHSTIDDIVHYRTYKNVK